MLQKTHPTTSLHSVPMELLRPSRYRAGTTSHRKPNTELSLLRRLRRSGAGKRKKEQGGIDVCARVIGTGESQD